MTDRGITSHERRKNMNPDKPKPPRDRGAYAIGGGLMTGLGVGFFFFPQNIFAFIGSILAGIGLGLILAAILPKSLGDQV